jgi:hypothetical protein
MFELYFIHLGLLFNGLFKLIFRFFNMNAKVIFPMFRTVNVYTSHRLLAFSNGHKQPYKRSETAKRKNDKKQLRTPSKENFHATKN